MWVTKYGVRPSKVWLFYNIPRLNIQENIRSFKNVIHLSRVNSQIILNNFHHGNEK